MVKVVITLPVPNLKIIGGYKVVYEYANYLSENGMDVSIIYNAHDGENARGLPRCLVLLIRWMIGTFGPGWFKVSPKIHRIVVPHFSNKTLARYDILIATATETAEYVNKATGRKIYFVQDFEDWGRSKEDVLATYRMNMEKITISKWLKSIIDDVSEEKAIYIPNGIDRQVFCERKLYEERGNHTLCALFHWDNRKGCDILLKILYRLKERYSTFEAYLFGTPKRKQDWPEWIHYTEKATPREVSDSMNCARVFLCTSRQEGFGLTGLESLFCGCVLVTTDCCGVREYASQDNAYMCEVDDENGLFESICMAFENKDQCDMKRKNANAIIHNFDSSESKKKFYDVITNN